MEKSCGAVASRRGGEQQKPASGKKKMEPKAPETNQNDVVLGWSYLFIFNQNTPKRHCFKVLDFLFFFKRHLKNDFVLGFQQPKRHHFVCLNLKPYKTTPLPCSDYILKPSKKPFKNTLKSGLKREEEEDSKRYFFSFFLFLL